MKSPSTPSVNHLALGKAARFFCGGFLQQLRWRAPSSGWGASMPICIQLRQAARLVGFVAHLGAQCLEMARRYVQKARRVVRGAGPGFAEKRLGQFAAYNARIALGPQVLCWLAQRRAIQVHHQALQVLQGLAQLAGLARNVGHPLTSTSVPMRSARLVQAVDPAQAWFDRLALQANCSSAVAGRRCARRAPAGSCPALAARAPSDDASKPLVTTITRAPTSPLRLS